MGNGDSFFFDFGPGCLRNIIAMGHSQQLVQDIFITHLHVDHGQDFSTWSYETERPMSLELLSNMVKRKLPAKIYRCKGVVYAAEAAERRAILQVVGRRTDVALEDEWGERSPGTRIVAIGAPGSIDHDELTALFDSCVVEPATARR